MSARRWFTTPDSSRGASPMGKSFRWSGRSYKARSWPNILRATLRADDGRSITVGDTGGRCIAVRNLLRLHDRAWLSRTDDIQSGRWDEVLPAPRRRDDLDEVCEESRRRSRARLESW